MAADVAQPEMSKLFGVWMGGFEVALVAFSGGLCVRGCAACASIQQLTAR